MIKAFIQAARLRTLPLSVSGIIVGCGLSNYCIYDHSDGLLTLISICKYDYSIFILALFTTIGLLASIYLINSDRIFESTGHGQRR